MIHACGPIADEETSLLWCKPDGEGAGDGESASLDERGWMSEARLEGFDSRFHCSSKFSSDLLGTPSC